MHLHPVCSVVLACFLIVLTWPAVAEEKRLPTDANIVTALDVSDSVMRHDEWLQFRGLAKAIMHPAFLQAVTSGRHGRVGFAVFAWSSDGAFTLVVPWKLLGSSADARRAAAVLEGYPSIGRWGWSQTENGSGAAPAGADGRTDLSAAIDFAIALAEQGPFHGRTVINVAGNGIDNVGAGPSRARDRAVAAGLIVNGLVIGASKSVVEYFRADVQGGPGSFVNEVDEPADMAEALLQKLLRDLISVAASGAWS